MFVTSVVLKWDAVEGREKVAKQGAWVCLNICTHLSIHTHMHLFSSAGRRGALCQNESDLVRKKRWTCDMCNRNHHAHKIVI
jgi:hypothetical protein